MSMNRRDLIRTAAMGAAAAALSRAGGGIESAQAAASGGAGGIRYDKAPCRFCGTGCHVQVGVQGGRIVSIRGDEKAAVNNGLLCMKGYHVGLALYGKDRLTQPLLRKNGALVPMSWEEAIETIAERVQMATRKALPSTAADSGRSPRDTGREAHEGRSREQPPRRQRAALHGIGRDGVPRHVRRRRARELLRRPRRADVVHALGQQPGGDAPVLFSRHRSTAARGEKRSLIDIGTRRTRTTQFADHYLEFKPNTDLAIANAIAHLLSTTHLRQGFVERHCAFRVYLGRGRARRRCHRL
jgi:nitrate reductase NapA